MHILDQMTPNERLQAFMIGNEMDRILAMPILLSIAHRVIGKYGKYPLDKEVLGIEN